MQKYCKNSYYVPDPADLRLESKYRISNASFMLVALDHSWRGVVTIGEKDTRTTSVSGVSGVFPVAWNWHPSARWSCRCRCVHAVSNVSVATGPWRLIVYWFFGSLPACAVNPKCKQKRAFKIEDLHSHRRVTAARARDRSMQFTHPAQCNAAMHSTRSFFSAVAVRLRASYAAALMKRMCWSEKLSC